MRVIKTVMLLAAAATLVGCQVTRIAIKSPGHLHTPPPHASAHGYYKRYPHLHRWDDELGLYIFLESPDTYYDNNYYFRWSIQFNRWERAREPRGVWRPAHEQELPPKLIKKRGRIKKRHNNRPAPHAPAYGYYKKYPNKHRYDDNLGLYILLERPDTYYDNNYYFRWSIQFNHWERAREPGGNWRQIHERELPPKLMKQRNKIKKRKIDRKDKRSERKSRERAFEKEVKQKRPSNKRENREDRKEWKKGRPASERKYLAECEENGKGRGKLPNRCRD